jgi:hypothetical protein
MLEMKKRYSFLILVVVVLSMLVLSTPLAAAPIDVALTGSASESSIYSGGVASRAIDGNTNGDWYVGSVTHTYSDYQAWWQVQLTQVYDIDSIVIWNRTDCCPERLSNFRVSVFNGATEIWGANYGPYPNPSQSITLPDGTAGDIVRVMLNGTNYLSLAEVQVFNDETTGVPEPVTMALTGLGLLGLGALARRRAAGAAAGTTDCRTA